MNISSAQPDYSITSSNSSDIISIDLSSLTTTSTGGFGTITLNGSGSGYTIGSGISSTTSWTSSGAGSTYAWETPEEWTNSFPDFSRIQQMCEMYPGLKIAFEKFKTTYELVKEDFDAPPEKRVKP